MRSYGDIAAAIAEEIGSGRRRTEVGELWGGSKALFLLGLLRGTGRAILVITPDEEQAETLIEDLRFFADMERQGAGDADFVLSLFPSLNILPFEDDAPDSRTMGERMLVLFDLIAGKKGLFVASAANVMQKLPSGELLIDSVKTFALGSQADPDGLVSFLVSTGYEPSAMVTRIGEFSRRGGILDVFSPFHQNPVRMEFFGDAIESLREFDIETQRSVGDVKQAVVIPVQEPDASFGQPERRGEIHSLDDPDTPGKPDLTTDRRKKMGSIFQYLPTDGIITIIEPDDVGNSCDAFWEKIIAGRQEEASEGRTLPETGEVYLDCDKLREEASSFPVIDMRLLPKTADAHRMDTKSPAYLGVRLTKPLDMERRDIGKTFEGTIQGLVEKIRTSSRSNRVFIVCGTDESRDRIRKMLSEYGLILSAGRQSADQDEGPWPAAALVGRLSEGFSWPEAGLIFITEEEIFGSKAHPARGAARKSKITPFLSSFKELKPGDFVVHTDYGVGEYQGLTHIVVDGYETDYLTLRYDPDAKLHVPLYSLDKVQKHVGIEGSAPKVDRLGSPAWTRTKERIRKDILEMARELVAIYAEREAMERSSFTPPDNLYREFESVFPYEETPDQQKAIEDVLADMQRPRPMDRLVCGDVGYGKTEVALRAAFKAVEDGMQAAVLVPTTLLADQHFRTFTERLAPFSVRVEMLSRFRTQSRQKAILKELKTGTIDIVIGTHRLLQKDVSFRNLGLLVVDEEQRFGVRHKERIKEMKRLVDVLTLTATPIPRTLHMSLAGLRDLSIIQTPPLDRQAIQVILARFGKRVIREAIMRETDRGGRVFFVHNRVTGIERIADFIRNIAPEAKVGVGHGQLKEHEIEDVMTKFISGELNVLVTTTIIESGIDIPQANTIIINRADRFGLSDLYQIKGRVGRGGEKAYAYLLTPEEESLSEVARKRLRAIQELSELGAGFRIAAQDLETRGAGNLLGRQQSGHIAAVGIDLYSQMMEDAVAELGGRKAETAPDTQINLAASAFIPEDYIADMGLRLAAYKEISGAEDETELEGIRDGLKDRYGELPEQARNLLEIMNIRIIARAAGVARLDGGNGYVNITFAEGAAIAPDRVMALLNKNKGRIKLIPEYTLQVTLAERSPAGVHEAVKKCLQELR